LLKAMKQTSADARIDDWWKKSSAALVTARPRSSFIPRVGARAAAAPATKPGAGADAANAKPTELAVDDGKSAGKKSLGGSGHAVAFEADGEGQKLVAVKIFGSRYGAQQPPAEDFHVYLCDADGKQIKDFAFPYKLFLRGGDRWVTLKLAEPTEVPKNFILCVSFNPTQSKGVYVHYDKASDGDSRTGLPGELNDAFAQGDWMIRATVSR
jgi:RNA polymerase sigma-70 factor (ECF subfamily)